jgi:hypothetical protein
LTTSLIQTTVKLFLSTFLNRCCALPRGTN